MNQARLFCLSIALCLCTPIATAQSLNAHATQQYSPYILLTFGVLLFLVLISYGTWHWYCAKRESTTHHQSLS